uniref:Uncharacterized protein n=1 Tax=Anguilla anguilla TaxID=7936 RepID=A0A0E9PZU1_ANGAN
MPQISWGHMPSNHRFENKQKLNSHPSPFFPS